MAKNKVIVFIVEGNSDRGSLEAIFSELYEDKQIVFSVVGGDITTENGTKVNNIESKITSYIKQAMDKDKFEWSNINRVVHLVDMDGAYIPDSNIIVGENDKAIYTDNNIIINNPDNIKNRNELKRQILNKLSSLNKIFRGLRYDVYFMSCNLDDVLHNIKNATDDEKKKLSQEFEDYYYDNPELFIEFINGSMAISGSYSDTWDFIKKDLNSLHRHSNLNKFFEE